MIDLGVVVLKRRIKMKPQIVFSLIVSFFSYMVEVESMPQNRNRNNLDNDPIPGSRNNPIGGFRPIINRPSGNALTLKANGSFTKKSFDTTYQDFLLSLQGDHVIQPLRSKMHFYPGQQGFLLKC